MGSSSRLRTDECSHRILCVSDVRVAVDVNKCLMEMIRHSTMSAYEALELYNKMH